MDRLECIRLFEGSTVAVLGTTGKTGPHLVPIVFAVDGDSRIVTCVDHKPKSTRTLERLGNIRRHPSVSVLANAYHDDWDRLWWVRVDGVASVVDDPAAVRDAGRLLASRYAQYHLRPPEGPLVDISVVRWSGWRAQPSQLDGETLGGAEG